MAKKKNQKSYSKKNFSSKLKDDEYIYEEPLENILDENYEHKLNDSWTLYLHTQSQCENYKKSYIKTCSFNTCEGWARLINNVPDAGILISSDKEIIVNNERIIAYSLFKKNIKPEWEDKVNINGAEWGCREELSSDDATNMWYSLTASIVGGELDVLGIRVINKNICYKNMSKLEVWMSENQDPAEIYGNLQKILYNTDITSIPNFHLLYHDSKQKEANEYTDKRKKKRNKMFSNF